MPEKNKSLYSTIYYIPSKKISEIISYDENDINVAKILLNFSTKSFIKKK